MGWLLLANLGGLGRGAHPPAARPSEKAAAGHEQAGKSRAHNGARYSKRCWAAGWHGCQFPKSNLAYVPQTDITEDADTKNKLASNAGKGKEVLPASTEGQIKVEQIAKLICRDDRCRTISRSVKIEDGL